MRALSREHGAVDGELHAAAAVRQLEVVVAAVEVDEALEAHAKGCCAERQRL